MQPQEHNPKFTNPLIDSTSPYLRQHAHNPVYWYPWGEAALTRAKAEDKPILISIGYSTCYWCHVMEREVFENPSIAAVMNEHFINIKIDREELPELDTIYMLARQLLTREGGWPNNVWLTPMLKPFFAGGTFGPADAYGKPGFSRLLDDLHRAWREDRAQVEATAQQVTDHIQHYLKHGAKAESAADEAFSRANIHAKATSLFETLRKHHDDRAGGFFIAPKFPQENYHLFLLNYHRITGAEDALHIVAHSLAKMAAGGIFDHVGGGFHRYATDRDWMIPHFEKMLYNQALMSLAYTRLYTLTADPYMASIARATLEFTSGPLTSPEGGFYTAIDAESEGGVEGAYYVWRQNELKTLLADEQYGFLQDFYGFAAVPAYPGHKHPDGRVMFAHAPLNYAAAERGLHYIRVAALNGQVMNTLLAARNTRTPPRLDNKMIASWNGLMIAAFAEAAQAFGIPRYADIAEKAAECMLRNCVDAEGKLMRVYTDGAAQFAATLEDYAYMVQGLLALHRATNNKAYWLREALRLMDEAHARLHDCNGWGYWNSMQGPDLLLQSKTIDDGALPAANAVMLANMVVLYHLTNDEKYLNIAAEQAAGFLPQLSNAEALPEYATYLSALQDLQLARAGQGIAHTASPVSVTMALEPGGAKPGEECTLNVDVKIEDGWYVSAASWTEANLLPTQIDVGGEGVAELLEIRMLMDQRPLHAGGPMITDKRFAYRVKLRLEAGEARKPVIVRFSCQPCREGACGLPVHIIKTL